MSIENYHKSLMQKVYHENNSNGGFYESVFTEMVCNKLVDSGVIEDFNLTEFKKDQFNLKLDAYHYNKEFGTLLLVLTNFRKENELSTITPTAIKLNINKVTNVYKKFINENIVAVIDESDPVHELAYDLYNSRLVINKINVVFISNSNLEKRDFRLDQKILNGILCSFDIWDLGRFYRTEVSGMVKENVLVDFKSYNEKGIRCLEAFTGSQKIKSYLLVIPGIVLADIYDKYGERILEQNVRTFLQFRGKVNKGIRNTIKENPDMFFSYNNGITATAGSVIMSEDRNSILSISDFQIVNGGQTTASIFLSFLNHKVDLNEVFVQVKLSIIPNDMKEVMVPLISEYSNTQNKVSAADFFSNTPYHRRLEDFSRKTYTNNNSGLMTLWFYERARGQYLNAQNKLDAAGKRSFLSENRRDQLFTKTDVAKYIHIWDQKPHIVCRGAQKNFSVFASNISKKWKDDSDNKWMNELYFKEIIAKAIVFRRLDKKIMKQNWYSGYKAQIVAYSISYLSYYLSIKKLKLDFNKIWNIQDISSSLLGFLLEISSNINSLIHITPTENMNVSEWCKKPQCWEYIRSIEIQNNFNIGDDLYHIDNYSELKSQARKEIKIDEEINHQIYVVNKTHLYWRRLFEINKSDNILSDTDRKLLVKFSRKFTSKNIPNEIESKNLVKIEKLMMKNGIVIHEI